MRIVRLTRPFGRRSSSQRALPRRVLRPRSSSAVSTTASRASAEIDRMVVVEQRVRHPRAAHGTLRRAGRGTDDADAVLCDGGREMEGTAMSAAEVALALRQIHRRAAVRAVHSSLAADHDSRTRRRSSVPVVQEQPELVRPGSRG